MKPSMMKSKGKPSLFPAALFNRRAALMLATGTLLLSSQVAFAGVNDNWTGANGNFNDLTWSGDKPPTANDNAILSNGAFTVTINTNETVNDIVTDNNGTYTQTSGTVGEGTNGGWFRMGTFAGSNATYNLQGGILNLGSASENNIGENNGATGVATLSVSGGATLNNTAGGFQIAIGGQSNNGGGVGTGIFNLSDATSLGTIVNNNNELWLGENNGSTGTMNMSGGTLNQANWLAIGRNSATGTLNLSGGTLNKLTATGNITLAGIGTAQTGTINQTGGSIVNTTSGTWIGETGHGVWNISAGSANLGGTGYLDIDRAGTVATASGIVNLSGTGLITVTQVQKTGGSGTGTFNFNGGTLQASKTNATFMQGLTAANVQAGGATIDPNSFTVTIAQPLLHSGTGTDGGLTVNDSTATPGTLILTGASTYTGATTITKGTLQLGNGTTDGTIATTSGVTDNSALVYNLHANRNPAYVISGTGSVTLNDTGTTLGTLTFNQAETYTGATNVAAGTLTLDHSGTNTGSLGNTAVNVGGAGTLFVKGSTTIGSPGTGSLTVGPGTVNLQDGTINTLGIGGGLTLASSNLNFDLGTASGSNDAINVGGAVTTGGTTTLNLDALGSIVSGTSSYTLISAAGGGLPGGTTGFVLGTKPAGFNQYSLASSTSFAEILSITANPTVVGAEYWTGAASRNNGDTANNFGFGATLATPASNYSTDRAGTIDPKQVPGATTDLIFTANNATPSTGSTLNTQLDANYNIHSLTFDVPAVTTITSTVINTNGDSLTIGAGGLTVASTSNSSGTINGTGSVILNGNQSFADNNALGLTITTPITGSALTGTNTLTFAGTGSGPVLLSGVISDGSLGGKQGLVVSKTGGGVLTLSGANTYSGGNTLNSGQVVLGSATALGAATNTLTFGSGSTSDLQLGGNSITVGGLNTNPTVGTPVIENASATAATLTNALASGTANYGGVLQDGAGGGALALTETGGGVQTLSGANTYTGGTTVNATGGGLTLGAGGTLGAATNNVAVTAGTLDLGGQSITQNSLTLGGGSVVGPTGTLTLSSTGTAVLISGGAYTFAAPADTANLLLNGGNIVKTLGGTSGNAGNGNPNIAGNITLGSAGSTVALQDSPGDLAPELSLTGVISGPGALTQDNTVSGSTQEYGTLLLSGANTYTGGTNITVGRTEIANSSALGTGAVTVGTRGTLALGGGAARNVNGGDLTVANNLAISHGTGGNYGNDAIESNFGANTLTGTISLTGATEGFTINGGSLNQTNVISGTGTLLKYGGSLLTLSGVNTYSGGTGINAGTLNVNSAETPGVSGPLGSGGTISFGGGILQYSANNNFDYSSRFATTAAQLYDIDTNGQNVTFATPLASTGASQLNKYGAGTLTLNATANTVGQYFLHGGTTVLSNGASITTTGFSDVGGTAVGDNATLTLNDTSNVTVVGDTNISDVTGSTGVLNLNGTGTFKGTTLFIGKSGTATATVNQSGGTVQQTGGNDLRIGGYGSAADAASVGTYNLSGGTFTTPGNLQFGAYGHGTLNQTGGTVNAGTATGGFPVVGRYAGGVGTVNISAGAFNQLAPGTRLIVGEEGTGVANLSGTGVITSTGGLVEGLTATGNGTFNLGNGTAGGTLVTPLVSGAAAAGTTALGTAVFNFNGGTLQDATGNTTANNAAFLGGLTTANVRNGGAIINTNGNTATIGQALLHSTVAGDNATDGGLTVNDPTATPGTLILTGTNTYTGATTITGGNLQVGNGTTGSIASTSAVNVGGTTTLTVDNNGALNNTATAVTLGSGGSGGTLRNALNGTATPDGLGNTVTNNVQQAGTLSLRTGTSDILDFAGNTGTFDFTGADTSLSPGQSLTVENFGAASNEMLGASPAGTEVGNYQLLFNTALTPTQLADISFLNSDSTQFGAIEQQITSGANNSKFQVLEGAVAAPEPAQTGALGLFGLGLGALILKARKRTVAGSGR